MLQFRWLSVGMLLLALLAWMVPLGVTAQDQPVIKLGATISQTGKRARTGALYVNGRQLGLDVINANGGVDVGGTAYQMELTQFDDQSDADLAVRLYNQLVQDEGVDFLLGPYSSGLVIPTSAVAEKFGIPMVEGGGASSNIFNRDFKNVFGLLPVGQDYLRNAVDLFAQQAGAKTVALIYADDAFSTDVAEGTRKWVQQAGAQLVADEKYSDGQTEFGSLIAKLKGANPDVIVGANHFAEAVAFVQQARAQGLDTDLVFTVGVTNPDFVATLGDAAENVFGVTPWVSTLGASDEVFGSASDYAQLYADRFESSPDYHSAAGTMEVFTFKQAIEAAGSLDRDAVRQALQTVQFDSFYGPIAFKDNGQIDKGQVVVQIQGGQVVAVGGAGAQPIFKVNR